MIDIGAIRGKIIDLALQGKLSSYNDTDSNVEQLLEMIFRKNEINASIPVTDLPFEIPQNWRWIKLGWVMNIDRGGSPRPIKAFITNDPNGINWIKIGDVAKDGKYITETKERIRPEGEKKSRRVYPGDFLLTNSMSFGRPYISKIEGCIHDGWLVLRNTENVFDLDFLYYLLSSTYAYSQFTQKATGSTVDNLNKDKVGDALVPLPPIEEQKRIVASIEDIFPILKTIDDLQEQYINDREILKRKLIDAAIQGKLTEQLPEDGTAEEMYQTIREKKDALIKSKRIKKDKSELKVAEEDIPFDIPNNWKWVCWGEIVNIVSARRVHQSDWRKEGIPFYRAREIAKLADNGFVDNDLYISEELYDEFSKSGVPSNGDLMVSAVGTLGKTYVVRETDHFYYKDASVLCFENYAAVDPHYLRYVMNSDMMKKQIESNSGGTTVDTLTMVRMIKYLLPLPPLAEQHRIVEKLDAMLSLTA